jgi:DNA-binding NarL/FixJ family response regulator
MQRFSGKNAGVQGNLRNIARTGLLPPEAWGQLGSVLHLSARELQLVRCIFEDEKREAIACRLGISAGTVNTYFQRLYTKLQVGSRPQLIVRVMLAYLNLAAGATEHPHPTT